MITVTIVAAVVSGVVGSGVRRMMEDCRSVPATVECPLVEVDQDTKSNLEESVEVSTADTNTPPRSFTSLVDNFRVCRYKETSEYTSRLLGDLQVQVTSSKASSHLHADAALYRALFEQVCYKSAQLDIEEFGLRGELVDVGGNYSRHSKYNRTIHCCTPILDTADRAREHARSKFPLGTHVSRCKTAWTLGRHHDFTDVFMFIDVCYYIPRSDIYALARTKIVYLYGHKIVGKSSKAYAGAASWSVSMGWVDFEIRGNRDGYHHELFDWDFSDAPKGVTVVSLVDEQAYDSKDWDHYCFRLSPSKWAVSFSALEVPGARPEPIPTVEHEAPSVIKVDRRLPQYTTEEEPRDIWGLGYVCAEVRGVQVRIPSEMLNQVGELGTMMDPATDEWEVGVRRRLAKAARFYNVDRSFILNSQLITAMRVHYAVEYHRLKYYTREVIDETGGHGEQVRLLLDGAEGRAFVRMHGIKALVVSKTAWIAGGVPALAGIAINAGAVYAHTALGVVLGVGSLGLSPLLVGLLYWRRSRRDHWLYGGSKL
jgi:hypothetical protein